MNESPTFNTKEEFDKFVYTPIDQVEEELERRRNDVELNQKVLDFLHSNIPNPLVSEPRAVLFRQVATPNYEGRKFIELSKYVGIKPLFWQYFDDKFVSNNDVKYYLGKLEFRRYIDSKKTFIYEKKRIVDFEKYNGKKFSEVQTLWGEQLTSFHRSLFSTTYRELPEEYFYDASSWFRNHGSDAKSYYQQYLALFIFHGVLFEDFMFNSKEVSFTKEIFLPAFLEVLKIFGRKPLIVELDPEDIDTETYWMCHPYQTKEIVDSKMGL